MEEQERLRRRLREVREYLNLSQEFVARQLGIARSTIVDIERGARKVDSLELRKFSKLFRYPVEYFYGDSCEDVQNEAIQALTRAAHDLTDKDQKELLRFAQFLRFYAADEKRRSE